MRRRCRQNRSSQVDSPWQWLELQETTGGGRDLGRMRAAIVAGAEQLRLAVCSVSFAEALESCLETKAHRSLRTLQDIRQNMKALMRQYPELAVRLMRSLDRQECEKMLKHWFSHSAARFIKARANLLGLFNHALRLGWCSENAVTHIPIPVLREREICALSS